MVSPLIETTTPSLVGSEYQLIVEYNSPEYGGAIHIDEALTTEKDMYINGIFLQGNKKNRNGRIYPTNMLSESVNRFITNRVKTKRAGGELNHPEGVEINLDRVSHLITELNMDGDNGIGKAKLLDTPCGNIAKSLVKGGYQLAVSTRGLGKLSEAQNIKEVSDFELITVDIVSDPSAPEAFVQGIMEGVQFYVDCNGGACKVVNGSIPKALDEFKESMETLPLKEKNTYKYEQIVSFLNKL